MVYLIHEAGASSPSRLSLMTTNLTDKEQALLNEIKIGMDEPGCGWLHEITPFQSDHVTAGVLGSLIEKGLVHSEKDDMRPWLPPGLLGHAG
jgi:hypothetical protein